MLFNEVHPVLHRFTTFRSLAYSPQHAFIAVALSWRRNWRLGTSVTVSGCSSVFLLSCASTYVQLGPQAELERESPRSLHKAIGQRDRHARLGALGNPESGQHLPSEDLVFFGSSQCLRAGFKPTAHFLVVHLVIIPSLCRVLHEPGVGPACFVQVSEGNHGLQEQRLSLAETARLLSGDIALSCTRCVAHRLCPGTRISCWCQGCRPYSGWSPRLFPTCRVPVHIMAHDAHHNGFW